MLSVMTERVDTNESVQWFADRGLLSNFNTGPMILITTPDAVGVNKIGVEWCRICFALVPEGFIAEHGQEMHGSPIP